ncbi:YjcZ family sporulation protein [Paenibacillus sp. TC-CSREp1]
MSEVGYGYVGAVSGGYGGFTSIGAMLVLFILLVIISKALLV